MAFDFGQIGDIISKVCDGDYIDIKRDIDGKLQEVYSNIPCHVAYASVDNPDPKTVDVKPIIQSITVHMQLWVDIRNNDFIVAKKTGSDGSLIATYSGRCGNPVVSQGRKKVLMQMDGTENDEPTPLPPAQSAKITVSYESGQTPIQPQTEQLAEIGKPYDMEAPDIEGYTVSECYIDGVLQETTAAHIDEVTADTQIRFVYAVNDTPTYFRYLVFGLYTKDDGSLASGWHLYKKVAIDSISLEDDIYTITSDDALYVHEDNGKILQIKEDTQIVFGNVYAEVKEVITRGNNKVTFTAEVFTPSEEQENAYICKWYD